MNKLIIENLNLFYGDFQALKNINMEIAAKEITAFIGPSGCGKSTLLKTLNRMNDLVDGCRGLRWRLVQPLHGSIQAACFWVITLLGNSILWL